MGYICEDLEPMATPGPMWTGGHVAAFGCSSLEPRREGCRGHDQQLRGPGRQRRAPGIEQDAVGGRHDEAWGAAAPAGERADVTASEHEAWQTNCVPLVPYEPVFQLAGKFSSVYWKAS
jgi:hypothetical protein